MIMSLVAAAVATSKILTVAKVAAAVDGVCIAAQPVVDEFNRKREDD